MDNIEDYVKQFDFSKIPVNKQLDMVSKMIVADSEVLNDTEPNAMVTGGLGEIGIRRVSPAELVGVLLCHPAVERGIEFKFNRLIKQLDKQNIGNNILPKINTPLAKGAQEYITEIMNNSDLQPLSWIKQFGRDAMRFGDNYSVLKTNKARNKVLRWELQNPIFFSPMFDITGADTVKTGKSSAPIFPTDNLVKFRINPTTKKPTQYTQLKKLSPSSTYYGAPYGFSSGLYGDKTDRCNDRYVGYDKVGHINFRFVPSGRVMKADRVMQLNFDRIGDEPFGIPIVQTLIQTVSQIVRVEDSSAETMIAFGHNRWMAHTPFRSEEKMRAFAKSIENIKQRSVVILPEGVKLETIKPGTTEFETVHNILLTIIAMRLGMSSINLKGTGADINMATFKEMQKDIRFDFFADELELEKAINDGIIKSCKIKYKLNTPDKIKGFPYPRFTFNEMKEDKAEQARIILQQSLGLRNVAFSVKMLKETGYETEADRIMKNYLEEVLPDVSTQQQFIQDPPGENK